jgi:hypothetical protein
VATAVAARGSRSSKHTVLLASLFVSHLFHTSIGVARRTKRK